MKKNDIENYLEEMKEKRGYVLEFHRILGHEDFNFLKNYDSLLNSSYLNPDTTINAKTKEMLLIAILISSGSTKDHIKTHMALAKQIVVTKKEMLEILELLLLPVGLPGFMRGFAIWKEVYEVQANETKFA